MSFRNDFINKNTPIPMYYQLKEIILNKIKNGTLLPGDLLPTEIEFINLYNISRTTVRQAIVELAGEGYLYRIKGKGTYVSEPKITQDFMQKIEPYSEQMKRLNMIPSTKVLMFKMVTASEKVANALDISLEDNVILIRRLRFANDEPIVVLDTYLPSYCKAIFEEDMEKVGLYEHLSKNINTKIVRVVRQVEAIAAGKLEKDFLEIPVGYPVQLTTTIGFNQAQKPIEYSIAHYRGDKNKFIIELKV